VVSVLAKREARGMGFDEALLMDDDANIAEGSGENLFVVCDGILKTPPTSAPILPGLTRATVLHLARRGLETFGLSDIREENISRGELLVADEVFLTGTAAEITPVRQVDLHTIGRGEPGPITRGLQKAYFELVRGRGARAGALAHVLRGAGALSGDALLVLAITVATLVVWVLEILPVDLVAVLAILALVVSGSSRRTRPSRASGTRRSSRWRACSCCRRGSSAPGRWTSSPRPCCTWGAATRRAPSACSCSPSPACRPS
jgi:hypothetical protein